MYRLQKALETALGKKTIVAKLTGITDVREIANKHRDFGKNVVVESENN